MRKYIREIIIIPRVKVLYNMYNIGASENKNNFSSLEKHLYFSVGSVPGSDS